MKKHKAVKIYLNKEQEKEQHELMLKDYMQRVDNAKTEEEADAIRAEWQEIDTAFKVALIKKYEGK